MKSKTRIILEIGLLGALAVGLVLIFHAFLDGQPAIQVNPSANTPQGEEPTLTATHPTPPYPAPDLTSEPSPGAGEIPYPAPSPWPTITPYPSPTSRIDSTSMPVPLVEPAKDAAGSILYLLSGRENTAALYSLPVDVRGMSLGTASKLSEELAVTWGRAYPSPDGSRIALFGESCAEAILYRVSGKMEAMFKDTLGAYGRFFDWHPDSRHLLILARQRIPGLWLVDTDTWEFTVLAAPGIGAILGGAVSPDGRMVVYSYQVGMSNPSEVWIVNTDGREARQLFTTEGMAIDFAWSPDGGKVVFSGNGLMMMNADGTNLHTLNLRADGCFVRHYPPIWSPDSRFILIVGDRTDLPYIDPWNLQAFQDTNICLVDVESGEARPLLPGEMSGNINPTWASDGSQIAFVSNRSGASEIWAVNVDGNNLRQLTNYGQFVRFTHWVGE